jgi:DHA1 family tetracycline resistance protein-like MFS transporter
MQFLCSPIQGGLSDRFGRRPVLLLSLGGTCCNYILLAWAPTLPWLFLGQLVSGATAASISTASAYIADLTPPGMRTQRFGLIGAAFALGFVLGPALGGLLGEHWIRLPMVVAAMLAGANAAYGWLGLPESLPLVRRRRFHIREVNPIGVWRSLASDPTLFRLALAWCCIGIAFGTLESSFVLANQIRLDWDARRNGLALVVLGAGAAVVQTALLRRIARMLGNRITALLSFALATTAYLFLAFSDADWMVFAGILFQAFGTMSTPAIQAMASARLGPDRQGEVQGALSSLRGLTAIAAPAAAGSLLGLCAGPPLYFPGAPFLLVSLIYAAGSAVLWGVQSE